MTESYHNILNNTKLFFQILPIKQGIKNKVAFSQSSCFRRMLPSIYLLFVSWKFRVTETNFRVTSSLGYHLEQIRKPRWNSEKLFQKKQTKIKACLKKSDSWAMKLNNFLSTGCEAHLRFNV